MEGITRPSITRIARRSGVKSISEDCFNVTRNLIEHRLDEIIRTALVVNAEHHTKTLMPEDIFETFTLMGENVAQSNDLGKSTCSK